MLFLSHKFIYYIRYFINQRKSFYSFLFFPLVLIYLELIFRFLIYKSLNIGFLFTVGFALPIGIILYMISTLFSKKTNFVIAIFLTVFFCTLYSAQFVYYYVFKTFLTIFSISAGTGQILEFWKQALSAVSNNLLGIIFLYIPFVFLIIKRKVFFNFIKTTAYLKRILTLFLIIFHLFCVLLVFSGGRELYSLYDIYFKNHIPDISMDSFGVATTMRLDIKNFIIDNTKSFLNEYINNQKKYKTDNLNKIVIDLIDVNVIPKPESFTEEPSKENIIEYNTINIDFSSLIAEESNDEINEMNQYFSSLVPTEKNEYTGIFKDHNLIFITAEGLAPYAIDKELTPTLYKLTTESFIFTNFYNPIWGVSTSDGEYAACTGLIPKAGVWSFFKSAENYMPFALGNQFKSLGYSARAYHNHTYTYYRRNKSHPNMGYDYKGLGNGLKLKKTWPESDLEMMEITIPEFINDEKFHTYYMTVSGHMLYTFEGNAMSQKNKEYVEGLPFSDNSKAYLACHIELDRALEYLIQKLEEAGKAENTVIAISPDHYPYGLPKENIDELSKHEVEENFELYKSTLIIWKKGLETVVVSKPCSGIDIIPTLSNLFGLEYDSRLLAGKDILSNSDPLVIFSNRSFITDKIMYNHPDKKAISLTDEKVKADYIDEMKSIVNDKFKYSAKILENDYYSFLKNNLYN
ncbi:MAG: sulfatase [Clostridia bacterium]|nr:sulfatase [Clostridia bacterium]